MKTVPAQLHNALISGTRSVVPEPRIIAGVTTIPAGKIVLYDVHEYGVLGGANLVCEIDNSDGAYTNLADIRPRAVITTQEGARINGVDYYVTRHVWNVIHCEPSSFADHPTTLRIEAKNNWELFAACSFQSAAWNRTPIGTIVDDIAAMAGVQLDRDASPCWAFPVDWQLNAAFPYQPNLGALIGEQDNAQIHTYGRFETDGSWSLRGLTPNPDVGADLGAESPLQRVGPSAPAIRLTALGYHPASTRIVVHGLTTSIAGLLPELEASLGGASRARRITVNARHLTSAALVDRLKQEAIEQREIHRTGTLDIAPDLRLQLWDVVALYGVAGVTNGSTWRITDIRTRRSPGKFVYSLTIRSTAAADTYDTDIPTDPVVIDSRTVRDNFDTYGSSAFGTSFAISGALQWLSILRFEPGEPTVNETGVVYDTTYKVEGSYAAKIPASKSVILNVDHIDLTAEGRFTSADFLCLSVYAVTPDTFIRIGFNGPDLDTSYDYPITVAGWTFIHLTRSQFDANQDWSDVTQIVVQNVGAAAHDKWVDDLRIVKEDPAVPTTYNDTGQSWTFSGDASDYEWHIYQDVAGVPYSLGQIRPRLGYRYQALRNGAYAADNHFATGVLFREAGNSVSGAGLVAFAVDAAHRYRLILHATVPRLELFRDNGTFLASVTLPAINLNTKYYLGLERDGQYLNAYLSTDGTNLFSGPNLRLHVADATYLAGRVGVEADGLNARFFQVRAGSPDHALTSEFAYYTDPKGHTHDYSADTLTLAALNVNTSGATAGQIRASADIYPAGDARGLFARLVDRSGAGTVTDHFRSGVIPTGYTWQTAPFDGVPTVLNYSAGSDYMTTYANTAGGRIYLAKPIPNAAASWQNKFLQARVKASVSNEAGIRVDNGTDLNYFEVFLTGLANATQRLDCRICTNGTVLPVVNSGLIIPVDTFLTFRILCYWNGSQYQFIGYLIAEAGEATNIGGFGSGVVTWCPAAGRAGLFVKHNNGGNGWFDAFLNYFL